MIEIDYFSGFIDESPSYRNGLFLAFSQEMVRFIRLPTIAGKNMGLATEIHE